MLAVSYFHAMSYRADDPQWKGRDRFLLSVGLYAIALYAALIEAGILPEDEIPTYGSDDSRLPMSGMAAYTPGMEITGGSLGQGLSAVDVEEVFREHADELNFSASPGARVIAFDGTALKGSFDNFRDAKAKQVLSAFAVDTALVLAHIEISEKSDEIPAVQKLLEELNVAGRIVTCDAMHCQKNLRGRRRRRRASDRPTQGQLAELASNCRGRLLRRQATFQRPNRRRQKAQSP